MSDRTIEVRWTDGSESGNDYYRGESPYFTIDHGDCSIYVYADQDDWENDVITAYYPKCNVVSVRFVEEEK